MAATAAGTSKGGQRPGIGNAQRTPQSAAGHRQCTEDAAVSGRHNKQQRRAASSEAEQKPAARQHRVSDTARSVSAVTCT